MKIGGGKKATHFLLMSDFILKNKTPHLRKGNPPTVSVRMQNWYSHYREQYGGSLKGKIELPYDPAIPFLGIYPNRTVIQKDTRTPMFIAALSTMVDTWKQPKCPSAGDRINMWYIYTMEYHSGIQKNRIRPSAATWTDPDLIILSEISQTEKDKYRMISLLLEKEMATRSSILAWRFPWREEPGRLQSMRSQESDTT